jgi:adenylate cyclase
MTPEVSNQTVSGTDVFISYASQDVAVANSIVENLEQQGIRCWVAPRDVKPGTVYADAIVRAINEAKNLVLVLSASAMASAHVGREVERAASKRKPIIAFRTDAAPLSPELEYFLSNSQWIDMPALGIPAALGKVAEAVGQRLAPTKPLGLIPPPTAVKQADGRPKLIAVVAAVIGVGVLVALGGHFWSAKPSSEVPATAAGTTPLGATIPDKSIAVLPFVDMSEKKDQEYFADGLAEEVLSLLATLPELKVISRTSSFQFKGRSADLRTVGSQLGVAYVVEGSVRRDGNRVRVTAQLIEARTGVHRWSESYDREVGDILRMQQEIAAALGRALQIEVGGDYWHATTLRSDESYTAYLRGQHALNRYDKSGLEEAISHYEHALDLDTSLVRVREGLAAAHFLQYAFRFVPPAVGAEAARQDIDKLLRESPHSAVGHALRARLLTTYDWDWPAAQREADTALSLDRNSGIALYAAADLAAVLGRWDEAERLFRNELSIDPLDADTRGELSFTLYRAGRYAEAESEMRRVLEISPSYVSAHSIIAVTLLARGQAQAALHEIQQEDISGGRLTGLAIGYYALRRKADSDSALSRAEHDVASQGPYLIALTHGYRGEADAAFRWLDRAYMERDYRIQYVKDEWLLSSVHSDPRYKAFLRKMKLPE